MARDHLQIGARPTQVPARPRSPAKSKVLIAKNLPPDPEGKGDFPLHSTLESIF